MFPLADQIARCFKVMKDNGFFPTLFVTREGVPPAGVPRAIHTPIMAREMGTLAQFVNVGGDKEKANMVEWDWERDAIEIAREREKVVTPEVIREPAR